MLSGKKVSILGLGISGFQTALFLKKKGFDVYASDFGKSDSLAKTQNDLAAQGVLAQIGGHDENKILSSDWVVVSPGISPFSPLLKEIEAKRIPSVSDIEVASWFCSSANIIGVTGAAGKTTMVSLIAALFQLQGQRALVCGNIGSPWVGELGRIHPNDAVVLELSSFQLYYTPSLKPKVGILMNISPNHLDWHQTMPHYVAAKLNLFKNQTDHDWAIIREKDRAEYFPDRLFKSKIRLFDQTLESPSESILNMICDIYAFPSDAVAKVLDSFQGIEHRLEKVGDCRGVHFVNDSKSTTPLSLAWALGKYQDKKVILLAGGRAKSKDFHTLRGLLGQKAKSIMLFGESSDYIAEAWSGEAPIKQFADMDAAMDAAMESAAAGDVILLSPACASFDQFTNYQERGQIFKEKYHQLVSACRTS